MNRAISSFAKTFLAVFFIAITTVSCSDDEKLPLAFEDLGDIHMKFRYNGVDYNTDDPVTYNLDNKTIDAIYGSGANLKRITLFMPVTPSVGTHFVTATPSDNTAYGAYFISQAGNVDMLADTGVITITHVTDDVVKGTFTFTGLNGAATVSVTEGSFLADR